MSKIEMASPETLLRDRTQSASNASTPSDEPSMGMVLSFWQRAHAEVERQVTHYDDPDATSGMNTRGNAAVRTIISPAPTDSVGSESDDSYIVEGLQDIIRTGGDPNESENGILAEAVPRVMPDFNHHLQSMKQDGVGKIFTSRHLKEHLTASYHVSGDNEDQGRSRECRLESILSVEVRRCTQRGPRGTKGLKGTLSYLPKQKSSLRANKNQTERRR
jgi:hypothetical protein